MSDRDELVYNSPDSVLHVESPVGPMTLHFYDTDGREIDYEVMIAVPGKTDVAVPPGTVRVMATWAQDAGPGEPPVIRRDSVIVATMTP